MYVTIKYKANKGVIHSLHNNSIFCRLELVLYAYLNTLRTSSKTDKYKLYFLSYSHPLPMLTVSNGAVIVSTPVFSRGFHVKQYISLLPKTKSKFICL